MLNKLRQNSLIFTAGSIIVSVITCLTSCSVDKNDSALQARVDGDSSISQTKGNENSNETSQERFENVEIYISNTESDYNSGGWIQGQYQLQYKNVQPDLIILEKPIFFPDNGDILKVRSIVLDKLNELAQKYGLQSYTDGYYTNLGTPEFSLNSNNNYSNSNTLKYFLADDFKNLDKSVLSKASDIESTGLKTFNLLDLYISGQGTPKFSGEGFRSPNSYLVVPVQSKDDPNKLGILAFTVAVYRD